MTSTNPFLCKFTSDWGDVVARDIRPAFKAMVRQALPSYGEPTPADLAVFRQAAGQEADAALGDLSTSRQLKDLSPLHYGGLLDGVRAVVEKHAPAAARGVPKSREFYAVDGQYQPEVWTTNTSGELYSYRKW